MSSDVLASQMTEYIIALFVMLVVKPYFLENLECVSQTALQIRARNDMFGLVVIDNSGWMIIDRSTDSENPRDLLR